MASTRKDYIIELGARFDRQLIWEQPDASSPPVYSPVNLTGYTAKMQIRPDYGSATLLLELSTANGRISITPLTGTISLSVSTVDINLIDLSSLTRRKTVTETCDTSGYQTMATGLYAVYDLELTNGSGEVYRLVHGDIVFSPQVTI